MQLKLKDGVAERLHWSRPDSLVEPHCSLCGARLEDEDVPTQLWADNGACAQLCDRCAEASVEVVEVMQ